MEIAETIMDQFGKSLPDGYAWVIRVVGESLMIPHGGPKSPNELLGSGPVIDSLITGAKNFEGNVFLLRREGENLEVSICN